MCKLMEDFLKEYSAKMVQEAVSRAVVRAEARGEARGETRGEARGKIEAIRSLIINGLITLNDLKASGRYTDEELAAISK